MQMNVVELGSGIRRIALTGRLDAAGDGAVETRFSAVAGGHGTGNVIDLSGVSFLASLGVRMLVACAKSAAGRGGRTVLLAPQPLVEQTLRDTGIDQILPIAADEARAREMLAA